MGGERPCACVWLCAFVSVGQGGSGFVPAGVESHLSAGDAGFLRFMLRANMDFSKSMMPTEKLARSLDLGLVASYIWPRKGGRSHRKVAHLRGQELPLQSARRAKRCWLLSILSS